MIRRFVLLMALATAFPAFAADTVVVIVRHAEKAQDDPRDPGLNALGRARAEDLAEALAGAPLAAVYATQFRRTQLTGEPAARANRLAVKVLPIETTVEAYSLALRERIVREHAGQTVLVIGHSNTVPELVEALSGQTAAAMPETEFDRLSMVILPEDGGPARVVIARY